MNRKVVATLLSAFVLAACSASAKPAPAPAAAPKEAPVVEKDGTPSGTVSVWAVDPRGQKAPEVIFTRTDPMVLATISPDSRWLLFDRPLILTRGFRQARPFILDRQSGAVKEGQPREMRPESAAWSGSGFWIDGLVHLDLNLKERSATPLSKQMDVGVEGRRLVSASVTGDGRRFAALVGKTENYRARDALMALDLYIGSPDGAGVQMVPSAAQPWSLETCCSAALVLAPDGSRGVLMAESPKAALFDTAHPQVDRWVPLGDTRIGGSVRMEQRLAPPAGRPRWTEDSKYVWVPPGAVYTRDGSLAFALPISARAAAWNPAGTLLAAADGKTCCTLVDLDGKATEIKGPPQALPAGFLPDGRLMVFRTTYQAY